MGGVVKHRSGLSRWLGIVAASSVCLALAACQQGIETAGKVDAPGVPVAFDTIEGAPDAVLSKVSAEVSSQATARRIELVSGESQPRYRLKGYLTAYSTEDGETALAFVWDVFDSSKKRAQRVSTTTLAKGQSTDPWDQIGEKQIATAASQSMNDVAAFLATGQPQAEAGDAGGRSGATSRALGFSAVQ
jgi:hypothetical protein